MIDWSGFVVDLLQNTSAVMSLFTGGGIEKSLIFCYASMGGTDHSESIGSTAKKATYGSMEFRFRHVLSLLFNSLCASSCGSGIVVPLYQACCSSAFSRSNGRYNVITIIFVSRFFRSEMGHCVASTYRAEIVNVLRLQ